MYRGIMLISWTVVKLNYGKNEQDMSDIQLFWNPLRKEQYLKNKVDIDLHLLSYKTTFSRLIMLSDWAYTNKPLISMLIMFHTGKSTEFLYFTDNHSQQLTKCLFKERKLYSLIHAFFFLRGSTFWQYAPKSQPSCIRCMITAKNLSTKKYW